MICIPCPQARFCFDIGIEEVFPELRQWLLNNKRNSLIQVTI